MLVIVVVAGAGGYLNVTKGPTGRTSDSGGATRSTSITVERDFIAPKVSSVPTGFVEDGAAPAVNALPLIPLSPLQGATLGASAIANVSGGPAEYYAVGSQIYSSTSVNGITWTTPVAGVNLSFVPEGLAAVGGLTPGLLAWNGTSVVFESLLTGAFSNFSLVQARGPITSGSLTYQNGIFYVAFTAAGWIFAGPVGGSEFNYFAAGASATAVGLTTATNGMSYIGYANASGLTVNPIDLIAPQALYFPRVVLSATIPAESRADAISMVTPPGAGEVAVAIALKNTSGSNIYLASGAGTVPLRALTTDGLDSSPSTLLGAASPDGKAPVYVGFTSLAGNGSVIFLANPVATIGPVPVPPGPSPPVPLWAALAIAVLAILALIGAAWTLQRRPREREPNGDATPPADGPMAVEEAKATSPPGTGPD